MPNGQTVVDGSFVWSFKYAADFISYGYNSFFVEHAAYSDVKPEYPERTYGTAK